MGPWDPGGFRVGRIMPCAGVVGYGITNWPTCCFGKIGGLVAHGGNGRPTGHPGGSVGHGGGGGPT